MKRLTAFLLALSIMLLPSCGSSVDSTSDTLITSSDNISLWVYPMNSIEDNKLLDEVIEKYEKQNGAISVEITYLDSETADSKLRTAVETMQAPDIVLGSPRPLLTEWGVSDKLVELSDIYPKDVISCVKEASKNNHSFNILPLAMNTYMMAINYDLFEDAGALRYINESTHTWTTEGFVSAITLVKNYTNKSVASVYCGGQTGDYGTRALVCNLYGGNFINDDHTEYTLNSEEILNALKLLKKTNGIVFDPNIAGHDSTVLFSYQDIAMTFCWDYIAANNADYEFNTFPMCFPTVDGTNCRLNGDIYGFSIFNNNDEEKISNCKALLSYIYNDDELLTKAVQATGYFPCVTSLDVNSDDDLYNDYRYFTTLTAECDNTTTSWAIARSDWWQLLRGIANGADIEELLVAFSVSLNGLES